MANFVFCSFSLKSFNWKNSNYVGTNDEFMDLLEWKQFTWCNCIIKIQTKTLDVFNAKVDCKTCSQSNFFNQTIVCNVCVVLNLYWKLIKMYIVQRPPTLTSMHTDFPSSFKYAQDTFKYFDLRKFQVHIIMHVLVCLNKPNCYFLFSCNLCMDKFKCTCF